MMDKYAATEQAYKNGYDKGYADAKAELVQCKGCRYRHYSISNLWCDIFDKIMPENGYCSFGERKN